MQISRHWRLNPVRYRLQGVRYENGTVSLQTRPTPAEKDIRDMREAQPVKEKSILTTGRYGNGQAGMRSSISGIMLNISCNATTMR